MQGFQEFISGQVIYHSYKDHKYIGRIDFQFFDTRVYLYLDLQNQIIVQHYHSIDSLYSTNSVNVYVPSDNQQFRYKIARGW